MARMTLIDINANDELPAVIRKCNDNFRRMSSQQSRDTDLSVRLEGERSDAALAEAMASVTAALAEIRTWVEQAVEGLRTWVAAEIAKVTQPKLFAPPVGTYLHCEQDPSATWSGTVWEKQPDGYYLVSAAVGDSGTVGRNIYTLTTAQMPQHSHTGPSHTHTMAHTHTGPSHTHAKGTLATTSAGAHTHKMSTPILRYASSQASNGYPIHVDGATKQWTDFIAPSAGAHTHAVSGSTAAAGTGNTGGSSASNTGSAGTGSTGTAGGSAAIDNMPLSIKVPLWKRTA